MKPSQKNCFLKIQWLWLLLVPFSPCFSFREPPKAVVPVVLGSVKYTAPHFNLIKGKAVHGGVIEARDAASNVVLWTEIVYRDFRFPLFEDDASDTFITSLSLFPEGNILLLRDETGRIFSLDLATRKVVRIR